MNGVIIPHTPIAVDFWHIRRCPNAKLFFLTHLHGDHIAGLTPTWSSPIYCTPITKKLLIHKLKIHADLINALDVNTSNTVWLDEDEKEMMTVTVLDANHCPGAAMFLFQGYFGTILHTGDFRYSDKMFIDTPLSLPPHVDILYLDNTYSNPRCEFPTRRQAMEEIFSILDNHPKYDVLIGTYTLGKEDLLVAMALHIHTWVVVSEEQYRLLSILDMPNVFTTDPKMGHIHVVPMMQVSSRLRRHRHKGPTIAIIPSALQCGCSSNMYTMVHNLYTVPYSDHSCFSEIEKFVKRVHPKRIVPIVSARSRGIRGADISDRADMTCYKKYMDDQNSVAFEIPLSVQAFMSRLNVVRVTGSRKRKSKCNLQGSICTKRKINNLGIRYDEDDEDINRSITDNGSDFQELSRLVTKPTTDKWELIPLYIPLDQQRSVWRNIGNPHAYFRKFQKH